VGTEGSGRGFRKIVDIARDKVEERPKQAMGSHAAQCTHTKAAVNARDTGEERFWIFGVGSSFPNLAPTS
jgi:hypothetical protein